MTSLPTTLTVGSFSSGQSFKDALASYRRAQYFVAGSRVTATSDAETSSDDEDLDVNSIDEETGAVNNEGTSRAAQELDQFLWEAEDGSTDRSANSKLPSMQRPAERRFIFKKGKAVKETTPLLRKAISFTALSRPRRHSTFAETTNVACEHSEGDSHNRPRRRLSQGSARTVKSHGGRSTFGQTLFNAIAILLGIGMLSEPLAFAYSGWVTGTILIIGYGFISCYTAKILAHAISSDPRLRSYSDIGRKAFGQSSMLVISLIFCFELFSVRFTPCSTTEPFYNHVQVVEPHFPDAPGSLWSPAQTNFGVQNSRGLGLAFGLFMAGFSGHSVIPSLAMDMMDPSQFDRMINWAFLIATMLYTCIGYAGYLMFGKNVSEEKAPHSHAQLNATIEILLGLDTPLLAPEDMASKSNGLTIAPKGSHIAVKRIYATLQRITLTVLSVVVSILVPDFGATMAFLGSFAAFSLCLIGPLAANIALSGRCSLFDGTVLFVGTIMAIWGTGAAFLTA
ncbi:hypothetical protein H0H92_014136 [Tricholoma furcatifolium]|nr:hypothetical protein H0H92_014136 [Tricholoma furcatifolium]